MGDVGLEDSPEEGMTTHSNILGKFHGQRSLLGYSPWGCQERDTTERLTFTFRDKTKFVGKVPEDHV